MNLSDEQRDRAAGILLVTACGDALGAPYEFGPPLADDFAVSMKGGGSLGWEKGEWTDDTSMAIVIAREVAAGNSLDEESTLDRITEEWTQWARQAPDVGIQTSGVLESAASTRAADVAASALRRWEQSGQAGGNGSLMRTAPITLGYLNDPDGLARSSRRISDLTHPEPDAGDACVLWCLAMRHAVLTGEFELRAGLVALPEVQRGVWLERIETAEASQPRDFGNNGWVVAALQGAWSAIVHGDGLVDTLERAVRGGRDTDTVAAIAGGLVGARFGASAVPDGWRTIVHGWPGLTADDLVELAERSVA